MGQELKLIIFLIWFPQATNQVLTWIYWWQVKEYRFDRFRVLLSSSDGRKSLGLNLVALKFFLLLTSVILQEAFWVVIFVLLLLDSRFLFELIKHKSRRPVFTQRARRIFGTSLVFIFLVVVWPNFPLLFGEASLLFAPALGILWTIPIVNKIKKKEVKRARERLRKVKPTVIGVTGSYGKTTTKDFIAYLLSQKSKTARTTGSENTEFGIARKTIKFVKKGTEFFVVEMGAYKKGEIKRLTDIARPQIGVITGIEPQHLSLFGSLEEIKNTKFELIEALPESGVVVINLSDKYCRELSQKARRFHPKLKVLGYSVAEIGKKQVSADIEAKVISANPDSVEFEVRENGTITKLAAPIRGVHFVENLTGAILVARTLGATWRQINKGCKTIKLTAGTIDTSKLKSGGIVIDDSYNTTPKGFESALDYLSLFKNKTKVVITPGIIELGKASDAVHKRLGNLMRDKVDKVILTSEDFTKSLTQGLGSERDKLEVVKRPEMLIKTFKEFSSKDSTILFEGRMPGLLMEAVEREKI